MIIPLCVWRWRCRSGGHVSIRQGDNDPPRGQRQWMPDRAAINRRRKPIRWLRPGIVRPPDLSNYPIAQRSACAQRFRLFHGRRSPRPVLGRAAGRRFDEVGGHADMTLQLAAQRAHNDTVYRHFLRRFSPPLPFPPSEHSPPGVHCLT